ncbi:MAG: hypothetical protein ACE10C_03000 [Candidatus Binatia bacterium]
MATRKCQTGLLLLLGALLLVACATVEAPRSAKEQPEAIILGMGTMDGSCGTTLCCSSGSAFLAQQGPEQKERRETRIMP